MAAVYAEAAREQLAAYIEANFAAQLAVVEAALGLAANALGRPSAVTRGSDASNPQDNRVEVYVLNSAPTELMDRSIFRHECEVAFTLFSTDALVLGVQTRMLRWESAWWALMGRGGSTLGGAVQGALCLGFQKADARSAAGPQIAIAVARVNVLRQER